MTAEDLQPVDHLGQQDLIAQSDLLKLTKLLRSLRELREITMKPDESPCLDHTYFAKENVFLTPPQTPVSDHASPKGCRLDSLWSSSSQICDFDFDLEVFYTNYSTDDDNSSTFYEFEDFRDLRKPMLKKDCMWGTGHWLNGASSSRQFTKASSESSVASDTLSLPCRSATTPMSFDLRPVSTTPTYLDERIHSSFAPISETSSVAESERIEGNATTAAAFPSLCLVSSTNETESEEEIDVVNFIDKPSQDSSVGTEQRSPESPQDINQFSDSGPESPISVMNNMKVLQRRMFQKHSTLSRGLVRVSHNDLERKRRDELKRKFEFLRQSIPELESNDRAPKVMVLKKAKELIPVLQLEEKQLMIQKENLKYDNVRLMEKLMGLSKKRLYLSDI